MPRPRLLTDAQVEEMAELYALGFDMEQLGVHYGTSSATIRKWLLRSGVRTHGHAVLVEKQERDAVDLYESGISTLAIGSHFGCNPQTVANVLQRRGLQLREAGGFRRLPLREDAFDVLTPESAYWIGLMATDGCVTGSHGVVDEVKIALKFEDRDHLVLLKSFLGSGHRISDGWDKHPEDPSRLLHRCRFAVRSKVLASSLSVYGVVPRKTYTLIAKGGVEAMPDFWAGVFDGDGYDGVRSSIEGLVGSLKLSSASEPFVVQCRDFLASNGVRGSHSIIVEQPNGSSLAKRPKYIVTVTGRSALDALVLLYVDRTPILARKAKAAAEMIMLGANGGIVGTKRQPWDHPQRYQAMDWAEKYLDGERALRAAA